MYIYMLLICWSFWVSTLIPFTSTEGDIASVHAMKLYRGNRNIAPLLLKLSTRW